jgi:cell division protein FtsB
MVRLRRRTSYQEYLYAALLTLGIIWFSYLIWGIFQKEERARADVHDTKAQLASLEAREGTLKQDLADLDTPRGKEAVLRETRGVARQGEEVIIVVPSGGATSSPPVKSWWQKLFKWF